jgi:alpha,alpha-trehalose phosphorylase
MRGNFCEGRPVHQTGTFINGFYESWPIVYGEEAFGFARTGQTIVNVTDCKVMHLYVDDEPFFLPTARRLEYERVLDMRAGTLDRTVLWETPSGKRVRIVTRRLASFEHRHVAAIQHEITLLDDFAPVVLSSRMIGEQRNQEADGDPRRARGFVHKVLLGREPEAQDLRIILSHVTANSGMSIACGVDHSVDTACAVRTEAEYDRDNGKIVFTVDGRPEEPIRITKFITYHTSRSAIPDELCDRAGRTLDRSVKEGFGHLLHMQREFLDDYWERSQVRVEADDRRLQQAIHWNQFQLIQAAGRSEGGGIAAKGLTGQAYEGQYFWDTEIYVLPFLTFTAPRIARNLLKFRHGFLDKARQRAREVNQVGALYPWRTINGDEASAYYAAGTAQYHINADIVHAIKKYVEISGDWGFLHHGGAELLIETARLYEDLGFYNERRNGDFCIHSVTGPDEYNTVVNNNTYTNLMARQNLRWAAECVDWIRDHEPGHYESLLDRTGLREGETEAWRNAAERMHVPFDEELGVNPQDDNFLEKESWDVANTPRDKFPLLLYHHPLVIYRHRVIKQADIVLAMFLLGSEFTRKQKKRNFDYYDPITTGDSSLSASIQSIIASEVGYPKKALEYFSYAVLMDLADIGGNVRDGAHIASMGGTWMALVYGFGGMRDYNGELSFNPRLPERWKRLSFPLFVRGQKLLVDISHDRVEYTLERGEGLTITHRGETIELEEGEPVELPNG